MNGGVMEERKQITVREYALKEGVTLGTVYRRLWAKQIKAEQFYGRWLISPGEKAEPAVREDVTIGASGS